MDEKVPIRVYMAKRHGTTKRTLRHQRIVSYLESVKVPKTLTEITEHLNARFDTQVSRKTVERDIQDLTDQYQITESPGRPSGYRIPEGAPREYHLELGDTDLQALTIAISVLRYESPEVFQDLTDLLEAKILHKLPAKLGKEMERLSKLCSARGAPSGRTRGTVREDMLALLKALRQGKAVRFRYGSPYKEGEERERYFGLVMLESFGGSFAILAEDLEMPADGASRIKRLVLPRIRDVQVTDADYAPPSPSTLRKWENSYGGFGGDNQEARRIQIRCGKQLGNYLHEHEIHPTQKVKKTTSGHEVELHMPIGLPLVRLLMGFAWDIERVDPPELRRELGRLLRDGLSRFK